MDYQSSLSSKKSNIPYKRTIDKSDSENELELLLVSFDLPEELRSRFVTGFSVTKIEAKTNVKKIVRLVSVSSKGRKTI